MIRVETIEADTLIEAVQEAVRRYGPRWHFAEAPMAWNQTAPIRITVVATQP